MANVLEGKSDVEQYCDYLEKSSRNSAKTPRDVNALLISQEVAREYNVDPFSIRFSSDGSIAKHLMGL